MFLSRQSKNNGVWVTPDLVEKANPYHDSSGRFTSRGGAGGGGGSVKASTVLDSNGRAGDLADSAGMAMEQGVSMLSNMSGEVSAATAAQATSVSNKFNSVVSGNGSAKSAGRQMKTLAGQARSLSGKMPDAANKTNWKEAADKMDELGAILSGV